MAYIYVDKLKFFCQKILPAVYDDSLSYYEVLNRINQKLNETIDSVNNQNDIIRSFIDTVNESIDDFMGDLIGEYDSDELYEKGMFCYHNNDVYRANATTTGSWDSTKWDEVVFAEAVAEDLSTYESELTKTIENIAPPYDPDKVYPYEVGDYISYNFTVYKCIHSTNSAPTETDSDTNWQKAQPAFISIFTYLADAWNTLISEYGEYAHVKDYLGNSISDASSQSVLTQMLEHFNSKPYVMLKREAEKIFTWNGYECTVEQEPNGVDEYTNIVNSPSSLPDFFETGETYTMYVSRTGTNVRGTITWYNGETSTDVGFGAPRKFTVPDDAIGCRIRVSADASVSGYTEKIVMGIFKNYDTNANMFDILDNKTPYYKGVYPENGDLNDIAENAIYFLNSNYGYYNCPTTSSAFINVFNDENVESQIITIFNTGEMWYRRRYSDSWTDWNPIGNTDSFGDGKTIATSQSAVTQFLKQFNSFPDMPLKGPNQTIFSWNGYECTVVQPANGTAKGCNIYADTTHLPSLLVPGNKYTMFVKRSSTNISMQIHWYDEHGTDTLAGFGSTRTFTVPANAVGCRIRVYANASTAGYTDTIFGGIFVNNTTNENLYNISTNTTYYKGIYTQNGNLNNISETSMYFMNANYGYTNSPTENRSGIITTVVVSNTLTSQTIVEFGNGTVWYRRSVSGVWGEWQAPNSSYNNYAKMYVHGNSMMVGAVWTVTTVDDETKPRLHHHPSAFGNAPYSVIAKQLNIPEQNINPYSTILQSSKGLLYNLTGDTVGSLLDNIVGNTSLGISPADLTDYDYLLTQISSNDLRYYPIGTDAESAGYTSIIAGIKKLVEYLNNNYPSCRLILLSAAPNSVTIPQTGGDPFAVVYKDTEHEPSWQSNDQTIAMLDTAIAPIAEKYHFKYINYQNMNLAYHWQYYTGDSTYRDAHFNNETSYRRMGEYLAEHI